jgi:hypothetical protein
MSYCSTQVAETVREKLNREFRANYWSSHEAQLANEAHEAQLDQIQMSYVHVLPQHIAEQMAEIELRIHLNETTYSAEKHNLTELQSHGERWHLWYLY